MTRPCGARSALRRGNIAGRNLGDRLRIRLYNIARVSVQDPLPMPGDVGGQRRARHLAR
jgi:hypothetical protein